MTLTTVFTPALNQDGYAKVTFVTWKLRASTQPKSNLTLVFSIMDITRKTPMSTDVLVTFVNSVASCNLFQNLGLDYRKPAITVDADGFEMVDVDIRLHERVDSFLRDIVGKDYLAKVVQNSLGNWTIDTKSLKLFESKAK